MQNIKIHFVCSGNVFRSRLAEAYARASYPSHIQVSSSGVHAGIYTEDYLSPWAQRISTRDAVRASVTNHRTISSQTDFDSNDIIVFMHPKVLEQARAQFTLNEDKCLVWDVKDREDWHGKHSLRQKEDSTARLIKKHVRQLLHNVEQGSWVDIVDEKNQPRNFALPITIANQKKLWHRGCHALLSTPNKHVVIQKRSKQIIFSPRMIDITLGGHVDSGENPQKAMLREISEELGITLDKESLRLIQIYKQSRYHPRYKRHARSFTYTYHAVLPNNNPEFAIQKSEVAAVGLLPVTKARSLVGKHSLKGYGKLNYTYAYYRHIMAESNLL